MSEGRDTEREYRVSSGVWCVKRAGFCTLFQWYSSSVDCVSRSDLHLYRSRYISDFKIAFCFENIDTEPPCLTAAKSLSQSPPFSPEA